MQQLVNEQIVDAIETFSGFRLENEQVDMQKIKLKK